MSGPGSVVTEVEIALGQSGIVPRGAVAFTGNDAPLLDNGTAARSVLLLGNIGGSMWPAFARWRTTYDGPDPLDTWSKSVISPVADMVGASAYFPSDPPWQPFQRWAMRAEGLKASPLGILIHSRYGLWHGYRGALGFPFDIEVTTKECRHPCDGCSERPCLSACPVSAVYLDGFDVAACRGYLRERRGKQTCGTVGCMARSACPIGVGYAYPPEQLRFHMDTLKL